MKILCAEYNDAGEVAVVPVGDDVLLRNNGDFYIPDYTQQVSGVPQLVVRICYFEEIGVGVRFYADSLEEQLIAKKLPGIMAASFDSSCAISALMGIEETREANYEMKVNGEVVTSGNKQHLPVGIEKLVAFASEFHTLKIGDYLFCGHPFRFRGLRPGDKVQMTLDGKTMLDFRIK